MLHSTKRIFRFIPFATSFWKGPFHRLDDREKFAEALIAHARRVGSLSNFDNYAFDIFFLVTV